MEMKLGQKNEILTLCSSNYIFYIFEPVVSLSVDLMD